MKYHKLMAAHVLSADSSGRRRKAPRQGKHPCLKKLPDRLKICVQLRSGGPSDRKPSTEKVETQGGAHAPARAGETRPLPLTGDGARDRPKALG